MASKMSRFRRILIVGAASLGLLAGAMAANSAVDDSQSNPAAATSDEEAMLLLPAVQAAREAPRNAR